MCEHCGCGENTAENTLEQKVRDTLDAIRPSLQSHGGGIELVSIDDDKTVKVRLKGMCVGCPGAQMTMQQGVERILKEHVPEIKQVIAVN